MIKRFKIPSIEQVLGIFLLFPFIGFINGTDVQPTFVLLTLFYIVLKFLKLKLSESFVATLLIIGAHFLVRHIFEIDILTSRYFLTSILSFLTPLVVYIFIYNNKNVIDLKLVTIALIVYTIIGLIHFYDPWLLSSLVSRSDDSINMIMNSGRGVRSLTNEPSHLGKILISLNLLIIYFLYKRREFALIAISTFIIFLLTVILSQSAYMIGMHFFLLLSTVTICNWKVFLKYSIFVCLILTTLILFIDFETIEGRRVYSIIGIMYNNPESLMDFGAFKRAVNIPVSIDSAIHYGFLGAGGSEEKFISTIDTPIGDYTYVVSNRNVGGFIEYLLRYGLLSIPFYAFLTYLLFISYLNIWRLHHTYPFFPLLYIMFITIFIMQDGSTVNPLTWAVVLVIFIDAKNLVKRTEIKSLHDI